MVSTNVERRKCISRSKLMHLQTILIRFLIFVSICEREKSVSSKTEYERDKKRIDKEKFCKHKNISHPLKSLKMEIVI